MNAPVFRPTIVVLLLAAVVVHASGYQEIQPRGKVTARVELDRMELSLADTITLTVSAEGPAPLRLEPIATLLSSSLWHVRSMPPQTTPLERGRERWQQTFRLEPRQPLEERLQLQPLRIGEDSVTWKPIPVTVTTTIDKPELSEARDITPIERLPATSHTIWILAGGFAAVVLCGAGLVGWRRRRRRSVLAPLLPSDQWALRELELLDARGTVDSDRYHVILADILRRYLEQRFDLHATEQTTVEFLETVRQAGLFPQAWQEQLRDLLHRCDLAKFARVTYSTTDCRESAQSARELITQSASLAIPPIDPSGGITSTSPA
jgi:LPXTG-motif cell wall-anchored protein